MKAVFLDRDNTLIANDGDLGEPEAVVLQSGVPEALGALREDGWRLIVVTNQGGVARGKYTENDVDAVHQRIAEMLDNATGQQGLIDRFYYCPYHPRGNVDAYTREHPWRKPQPGMLIQAARDLDLELRECWLVGDQMRDVEAGNAVGCRTILIAPNATTSQPANATHTVDSIKQAAEIILRDATPADDHDVRFPAPDASVSDPSAPTGAARRTSSLAEEEHGRPLSQRRRQTNGQQEPAFDALRRAVHDLAEEIRAQRLQRTDFTPMRMAAGATQLLVLLLGLLALMQIGHFESFMSWIAGAVLLQLVTVSFILLDLRE